MTFLDAVKKYFVMNFSLQLLGAVLMFAFYLDRRPRFPLRFTLCLAAYYAIYYFLPNLTVGGWFNCKYILTFLLCFVFLAVCFKPSPRSLLFCALAGYLVQHIAYNVVYAVTAYTFGKVSALAYFFIYLGIFAAVYAAAYFLFCRRLRRSDNVDLKNIALISMTAMTAVVSQILSMWLNHVAWNDAVARIYAVCLCLVGLVLQFGLFENQKLKQERDGIVMMLKNKEEQHDAFKDNMEFINMKCHDLKYQLSLLRAGSDAHTEKSLDEIEKAVGFYDAFLHTGNETLDMVLTEKSLKCRKYNIKFECMAEGAALAFMEPSDLYSMIGNLLDNCIESVCKESDPDKRVIGITVTSRNNIASVHTENYCGATLKFVGGLPQTSKADKNMHGFGVKSVRYLAAKYGGTAVMKLEGGSFIVDVIMFAGEKAALCTAM